MEETPFTIPEGALGDAPNGPDPNEPPVGVNVSSPTPENHTLDHTPENTSENAGDPVMKFVVQNFEQINAMYSAFSSKRKEINPASIIENDGHPVSEPWQLDSGETEKSIRDLVASPFTARIRDYDMPNGLKVPTNLRTYDGTTDPDDHLTIFMGTMDVHKLPEPAWCRFFHITLCGAARFWSVHQWITPRKVTLHMTDRSDGMMTGAFISGLRPGRFFKDLIARPPKSMEDLFIQAHNFIRADEANIENRLRDSRWLKTDTAKATETPREDKETDMSLVLMEDLVSALARTNPHLRLYLKTPAEIYATSEGKSLLRPPPRMFAPAHRRDRTRYCEFHNDHGHDTNDCVDLRKEIEACIRNGRLSHLARGAKAQNNSHGSTPSNTAERGKDQIDWKQKIVDPKAVNEVLMTNEQWSPIRHESRTPQQNTDIAFSCDDPIPEHCNGIAAVRGDVLRKAECIQISRKRVRESETEAISET
ncbi:hypothetical protein CTI12_AA570620 [Artemisia annua]|uniref:Reverse transcriptase domain-containing protein n=1 Tax=Artemisia annua TaxID=35608 RepID=A0A2U1KPK6_ARTAN|nr:hypothetical protein CTI12_AA570620 [Artemisia annua]